MIRADAFRNAAIRILQKSRTPLHFERIADRALTQKIILLGVNVLDDYMGAVLRHDMEQYGSRSAFVETAPGHYGLNPDRASNMPVEETEKSMPKTAEFKKAAIHILRGSLGPLHFGHITARAVSEGMLRPNRYTITALMGEILQNDVMRNDKQSVFTATTDGSYRLNTNHPHSKMSFPKHIVPRSTQHAHSSQTAVSTNAPEQTGSIQTIFESHSPKPPLPSSRNLPFLKAYVGKGGEHLVASKLLFLRYNVSVPTVDMGADLLVTKDGSSHYYIQVKTITEVDNKYRFHITINSFYRQNADNMFYVFVLRPTHSEHAAEETFLIIPHNVLEQGIRHKYIKTGHKYFSSIFLPTGGNFAMGSPKNDISRFVNNWKLIG